MENCGSMARNLNAEFSARQFLRENPVTSLFVRYLSLDRIRCEPERFLPAESARRIADSLHNDRTRTAAPAGAVALPFRQPGSASVLTGSCMTLLITRDTRK